MKHRFLTLISSLLLLTACSDSFLERAPEGNYVDVTYYTSDDALEQATAPLYNRAWFDLNSRAIVPLGSNRANDNFSRWGAPEFTNFKGDSPERKPCQCMDRFLLGHYNGQCSYQ